MTYQHAPLGDLASLQAGYGFPLELQGRTTGDYPFAKVGDISRCGRSTSSVLGSADHYVDANDLAVLRAKPIPAGSVIFAKIGEAIRQNHRVIAGCDMLIDNNAMAAVPTEKIDGRFLYHFLKTVDFYSLASATTVPALRKSDLEMLPTPCPPLPEQRRIAVILDKADALRTKRSKALAQLDRLAQSIFVEMFGNPAKNPKGWPVGALKELGKVSTGGTPPSAMDGMFGGDIPFVTPGDLDSNQPVKRTVTAAGAEQAGTVRAGATLVCCIGTIGKMGLTTVRCSFNQQLNAVDWFSEFIDDEYGFSALQFFKPTIIAWGSSTTVPIIKKSSFEKLSIPVPPLALQQEFARRSSSVRKLGERLRKALKIESDLFAALQDRAFKGVL